MFRKMATFAAFAAVPAPLLAQGGIPAAGDSGDTAWILVCSALVLL